MMWRDDDDDDDDDRYITYGIGFGITSLVLGVVCSSTLLSGCDAGLLFCMFFFFLMALLSYAFMISAVFDKASLHCTTDYVNNFGTGIHATAPCILIARCGTLNQR